MHPFRIEIPQADLDDLHRRIAATRWPDCGPSTGWERGVPGDYLRDLAEYWLNDYDWRAAEAELNRHPQFTTEIDGATVHFRHVRSPEPDATPLILTHGWPGSVAEFDQAIGPLTDPAAHGGDPADAFHLVIPSIPGYGFSRPLPETGWTISRVAGAWAELMSRLGYERYAAQGGDWGSWVSLELGRVDPDHLLGIHTNTLFTFPSGDPDELAGLSEEDQARLGRLAHFEADGAGYFKLLGTRPVTPSYALTDSPVGQLAWIVEKFKEWTIPADRPEEVVDRDQLLTTVTIYWLTGTAGSSAQMYYEVEQQRLAIQAAIQAGTAGPPPPPIKVPVGVAVFRDDSILPLRGLADRDLATIASWTEYDRGGHFPAMEVPEVYVTELRDFFRSLRP
jgi:epoxide hydrolase